MRRLLVVSLVGFITTALVPYPAHADPITVTSGQASISVPGSDPVGMTLGGNNFAASIEWLQSFVLPLAMCAGGCRPGDVISLSTTAFHSGPVNTPPADNDTVGSATVNGVFYPFLAFAGALSFTTPSVILPPASSATGPGPAVTLTAPFTLSGTIQGFEILLHDPRLAFTETLTGAGTATAQLLLNPNNTFSLGPLLFDFSTAAAVPEPITGLLLGGGLALTLLRRRRHTDNDRT